jgi:DNA-binding NarL/FixJ family response regulator
MRLLIADDHDLVLETIASYLSKEGGFQVETCGSLEEACKLISKQGDFDLVLLDYSMPGMNGLDGVKRALALSSGRPVALMSGTANKKVAQAAIDAGAVGFLPKTMAAKSLVNAVRFMATGETFIPFDFLNAKPDEPTTELGKSLTEREREVLDGLARGLANKEIARELDLQEVTIKLHVKSLCRKLDARNRTQAAMIGREAGIV